MSTNKILSRWPSKEAVAHAHTGHLKEVLKAAQDLPWFDEILSNSFNLKLGRANIISFWLDCWLGFTKLSSRFPRTFSILTKQF